MNRVMGDNIFCIPRSRRGAQTRIPGEGVRQGQGIIVKVPAIERITSTFIVTTTNDPFHAALPAEPPLLTTRNASVLPVLAPRPSVTMTDDNIILPTTTRLHFGTARRRLIVLCIIPKTGTNFQELRTPPSNLGSTEAVLHSDLMEVSNSARVRSVLSLFPRRTTSCSKPTNRPHTTIWLDISNNELLQEHAKSCHCEAGQISDAA